MAVSRCYNRHMTPEERLGKIETILEKHNQTIDKQNQEIERQNVGIRDLIVVSRTILTSIQDLGTSVHQLREAQAATDEKLNILIDTVDRIIRNRNGKE